VSGENELLGMALAMGRLTLAMIAVEEQRDALAAEVERLKAKREPGKPEGKPDGVG